MIYYITENFGYFYKCRGYVCLLHNLDIPINPGALIYDEFAILYTILSLTQYKMAFINKPLFYMSFAIIQADGDGVQSSFPLGSDGLALVSTIHLGLRFQLNIASLHIDEEVFDSVFGDGTHTIG